MTSTVLIGNSRIDVSTEEGALHAPKEDVHEMGPMVRRSRRQLLRPLPRRRTLTCTLIPTGGAGVRGGRTWGDRGSRIAIHVGADTTWSDFADDWMLTHEMIHLAFPDVDDRHHWIEEGISVYVEPFARVRVHHMDANQMWFEVVRDMPKGLPGPGDEGLDHTHTWGRTYWGGALFCLLADIEIHEKTNNQKGLQDALRGILDAGGNIQQEWDLEKALDSRRPATGVAVLMPLYEKMKDQPLPGRPASHLGQTRHRTRRRQSPLPRLRPRSQNPRSHHLGRYAARHQMHQKSSTLENLTIFAGRTTR